MNNPFVVSRAWLPVFLRNYMVWRKLFWPSLIGNIAEPLFVLVAFGFGVGALVGSVRFGEQELSYLLFLASGSICASTMTAASFEALYSAYSRMSPQKTWDGIMNAPVNLNDIIFAELVWAGFKSLFTASAILLVMLALGISYSVKLIAALPLLFLTGICFASLALIFNALAKGYDFFTYYITLFLTPMTFLSGVYFPRDQLPAALAVLADLLPLTASVNLVRPLFLDQWPSDPAGPLLTLIGFALVSFAIASRLTHKRFGLA